MQNTHKYGVAFCTLLILLLLVVGVRHESEDRGGRGVTKMPILYGYGAVCGNNDVETGEGCDDGDTQSGDGCSSSCAVETGWTCTGDPSTCSPVCGDALIKGSEGCDDDNTTNGDGCSSTCAVESGYTCSGTPSTCSAVCGDGLVKGSEGCDDDGTTAGDGCSAACAEEHGYDCTGEPSTCSSTCGDGVVASDEGCDDSDTDAGDGCGATCAVETGYECSGEPSTCTIVCGDGIVIGSEACDDGDETSGDGCSLSCAEETGFSCTGEPSSCSSTCGDGVKASDEGCDDGDASAGDGCSAACAVESGYTCSGAPSSCSTTCGDGIVAGEEECEPPGAGDCSNSCLWSTGGGGSSAGGSTSGRAIRRSQEGGAVYIAPRRYGGSESLVIEVLCGNDRIDIGEECDDGNQVDLDGCSSFCNREIGTCGDGMIQRALGEECEAEFTVTPKGKKEYTEIPECSEAEEVTACTSPDADLGGCLLLTVPECGAPPPLADVPYEPECGNGRKDPGEQCDFGGLCVGGKFHGAIWRDRSGAMLCRMHGGESTSRTGDGCSEECRLEYCGDGVLQFTEQCDNGSGCSDDLSRSCSSDAVCESDALCTYNAEVNRACTKTCVLCQGLYVTTLDLGKLLEGEHIVKVQVTNGEGLWVVAETSFEITESLLLTHDPGPVHDITVPLHEALSPPQQETGPPLVSIITDKQSYIRGFAEAALVSAIVTDADGALVTGLPPSSFKIALNGVILEDQVLLESWGEECGTFAWERAHSSEPELLLLQRGSE